MTKKINQSITTLQDGEETKILKTKTGDILKNISDGGHLFDTDVLKSILENDDLKGDKFKQIKSTGDIDVIVNESQEILDTSTINKCIGILETYKNSYLNEKLNSLIFKFLEENKIMDMDEKFLALSEDIRILICIYRSRIKKYGYSCGGGFGYFKTPTSCGGCLSGRENMEKANLVHLAKYIGERQYQVPNERIQEAQSNFLKEFGGDIENPTEELEKLIKIYLSKAKACAEKIKNQSTLNKIKSTNPDLTDEMILLSMIGFVEHIKSIEYPSNIKLDLKNKVAAYIEGTTRRWGSSGCEYGNYIAVWYNGKRQDKHIVYRDAYSSSKDDRSLNFDNMEIKNVEIKDNKIFITAKGSSKTNSRTYTFDFPLAKDEKIGLSKEEQEKFVETFEATKKNIMLEQSKRYEKNTMPVYCLPSDMVYNNMPGGETSYVQPRIETEYIDKLNGIGAIVIHKQIDHSADRKRQLAREGWLIKSDGTYERVSYENMRDSQRLSGNQIKMTAREIVEKSAK